MGIIGGEVHLRLAQREDCRLLWGWVNEPGVRIASFTSDIIPWEDHVAWFARKQNDSNCVQFIALDAQNVPIGQVRFDIKDEQAEIDISIDRERRGGGYGSTMIEIAMAKMLLISPVKVFLASIKPENKASIRAFIKAGFHDLACEGPNERHLRFASPLSLAPGKELAYHTDYDNK